MPLRNKSVVLTGAAGGIGSAIALLLARQGAELLLVGRDGVALERLRSALPHAEQHQCCAADLANANGIATVEKTVAERWGKLDILINNAGVQDFNLLQHQSAQAIAQTLHVNLLTPMLLSRALLPLLSKQKQAMIVNMGSSFGALGYPGYSAYCASKFGLRGFSEALRRELNDTGIRVLYIAPRATNTQLNPANAVALNRAMGNHMDSPQDVAQAVLKAIQQQRARTTLGKPERLFTWLNSIFPALIDKAIGRQLGKIKPFIESTSLR